MCHESIGGKLSPLQLGRVSFCCLFQYPNTSEVLIETGISHDLKKVLEWLFSLDAVDIFRTLNTPTSLTEKNCKNRKD